MSTGKDLKRHGFDWTLGQPDQDHEMKEALFRKASGLAPFQPKPPSIYLGIQASDLAVMIRKGQSLRRRGHVLAQ